MVKLVGNINRLFFQHQIIDFSDTYVYLSRPLLAVDNLHKSLRVKYIPKFILILLVKYTFFLINGKI